MIPEDKETPGEIVKMKEMEEGEEMKEEETTEEMKEKEIGGEMIEKIEEEIEEILKTKEEWIDQEIQGSPLHHQDFREVLQEASLLQHQEDQEVR